MSERSRWGGALMIVGPVLALTWAFFAPVLVGGQQFNFRDAAHFYYPLYQRVQAEWDAGRLPLWENEENAGMPLLGNPTAAVLYPGKVIYSLFPYAWAARLYIVAHTLLAFLTMLALGRSLGLSVTGSTIAGLGYAFGGPVLFQNCNVIFLVGAAWAPLGFRGVDRWVRQGRRGGIVELALVLVLQALGGDPQIAYLTGLCAGGYALGMAWVRHRGRPWWWNAWVLMGLSLVLAGILAAVMLWVAWTTAPPPIPKPANGQDAKAVAQQKAKLGQNPLPPPWIQRAWNKAFGPRPPVNPPSAQGLLMLVWVGVGGWLVWRARRGPVGREARGLLTGLIVAAVLAGLLGAAQLVPVAEFSGQTARSADEGPHDVYPFSLEPIRLVEWIWPNPFGQAFEPEGSWLRALPTTERLRPWIPSLYLGGSVAILSLAGLSIRQGPPWRVWLSMTAILSLIAALGEYTGPLWLARFDPSLSAVLGSHDTLDVAPVRLDGYFRDGDGGFYWLLVNTLPVFGTFRYPSKLLTLTALAASILAGAGWDRLAAGPGPERRRTVGLAILVTVLSIAGLAAMVWGHERFVAWLAKGPTAKPGGAFGPFKHGSAPVSVYWATVQTVLTMTALMIAVGLAARGRQRVAGCLMLAALTADLAVANRTLVPTGPQSDFEGTPFVLRAIEDAEKKEPAPGPYRVHRMRQWNPPGWSLKASDQRLREFVQWERGTLQPKYGIPHGLCYTMTEGTAELFDYSYFFAGFIRAVRDERTAKALGIQPGDYVAYYPRRSFDLWTTRYFVVPLWPNGWIDDERAYASFLSESELIYPPPGSFEGPGGEEKRREWSETQDVQIFRNRVAYPRAWVVHSGVFLRPIQGFRKADRKAPMEDLVYQNDPLWTDDTRSVHDLRSTAFVEVEDPRTLAPFLSKGPADFRERVEVRYPSPQRVELDVTLQTAGLVVLADVLYPGWRLEVDGKPADILRVNRMMRGAAVEAGTHHLVYIYDPDSFRWGLRGSMAGFVALIGTMAWARRRPAALPAETSAVE